jgi:peptide/nickel transport system permease protein
MLAGRRPNSLADHGISTAALVLLAIPNFWLGLLLVVGLAVSWPLFPVAGIRSMTGTSGPTGALLDLLHHLVLPTLALGAGYIALYLRTLRAGMVEAWQSDHVRAARARGLSEGSVLRRGVIRPALLPSLVVAGQNIGTLVGGSVVVETLFAIPGMGRLAFEAVTGRDTALLVGVVMSATLLVLAINLVVDIAMAWLDPRLGAAHA